MASKRKKASCAAPKNKLQFSESESDGDSPKRTVKRRSAGSPKRRAAAADAGPTAPATEPMDVDEGSGNGEQVERMHVDIPLNSEGIPEYPEIEVPPAPQKVATYAADGPRLMITKIVNENFKSYAGVKTLGPFHKSFSAIVGPNGSGKSNVIDSMLFVFGYRANKIRSKKISVLIHSSTKHQNVPSCTVEVHFQKIQDTGRGDNDYDVIENSQFSVSRTAFRDSSSYYKISGKKATYKEVAVLLRGSGIDLDHNRFLILQGEVEQIAMMKPKALTEHDEGMLEFLEDIIGSSRFKNPIELLVKRVEDLNEYRTEKLNRVKVAEKDKDDLEGPKNEAMEYLCLENEIAKKNHLLRQIYIIECEENVTKSNVKLEEIKDKMAGVTAELDELAAEKEGHVKKLKTMSKEMEKLVKNCGVKKEEFSAFEKQDVRCREDVKHCSAKKKKLEKAVEDEKKKLEDLKLLPEKVEKDIEVLQKKMEKLEKEKEKEEEKLKAVMESLKTETQGMQEEKETKEKELLGLQKIASDAKSEMNVGQTELDLYLSRLQNEESKLKRTTQNLEHAQKTLTEKKEALKAYEKRIPEAEAIVTKSKAQLEEVTERENKHTEQMRDLRVKVSEAENSMKGNQSRGRVLGALMEQKKMGKIPGIFGRLGDLGGIDQKYDVAISTACGPLDNIVCDSINTAQKCVEFLKRSGVGTATFIGLDKQEKFREQCRRKINTPENVPRLFDLVKVSDPRVQTAFYYALRDTLVATDLTQATRIAYGKTRYRVVTLAGQLIDTSGTMSGGGGPVSRGRMGASAVQDKVDPKQMEAWKKDLDKHTAELQRCREERARLTEVISRTQRELKDIAPALQKCNMDIKNLTEQVTALEKQKVEQEEAVKAAAPDKKELQALEAQVEKFTKNYKKAHKDATEVEDEVHKLHKQIMEVGGTKLKSAEMKVNHVSTQIDQIMGQITKSKVTVKTANRNMKKSEDKVKSLEDEQTENKEKLEKLEAELKQLEQDATAVLQAYNEAQENMEAVDKDLKELKAKIAKIDDKEQEVKRDNIEVKNQLEKVEALVKEHQAKHRHWTKELNKITLHKIDELDQRAAAGIGTTGGAADSDDGGEPATPNQTDSEATAATQKDQLVVYDQEYLKTVNKEDAGAQILILEEKLRKMKPNMSAITEFKRKEELYLKRVGELDKVTELRDSQRQLHDDLRRQRLDEFMSGFSVITNKLKEMYQMITLGGDAELELVDSLDPFSEGITFSVRPPKKSWKNISNLSGGEKTLSSLALVFALHHYKPTPLYVMDEIDAALDFKNVSIVANYIKERTSNAQFIIISLRNNMFELADRLVGIYKTYDCTNSVTINPKMLCMPLQEVDTNQTMTQAQNIAALAQGHVGTA